ncbi:hypothetical protein CROQUDRAFT_689766 [Cronartium quercuum f. sp. fusiforme G11]|uniref:Uncharacterized protein n=1 Tax=Cronartium quercuum f. sp. fusiforme G11 TaxID=708437 RepID=A0A9P6NAF5_9BASI|nr:hypothetical protein CROQUDRAFT_689766 [Cronartium quercuum f. sp. fusiforme G11]
MVLSLSIKNTGVKGTMAVMSAIQKHAAHLGKSIDTYSNHLLKFCCQFPDQLVYPPTIEYTSLFKMQPDNHFWNEGLFTNHDAPWAMDHLTQNGMWQLSYYQCAQEELLHLGWEFRCEMKWLVDIHNHLTSHLDSLQPDLIPPINPTNLIHHLLGHPILKNLSSGA